MLFTVLGFATQISLVFDLLSHFRVQYALVQLIGLIWMLRTLKKPTVMALFMATLIALFINLSLVWQYASPTGFAKRQSGSVQLQLLQINVLVFNQNYDKVLSMIQQSDADIVSVQEVDYLWDEALEQSAVLKKYPYQVRHLRAGNLLLSKIPLASAKIVSFPEDKLGKAIYRKEGGFILARFTLKGRPVSLMNLHPPVPVGPKYINSYLQYLSLLAAEKPSLAPTVILLGDLNTTPWSFFYKQYLQELGLKDAKAHHYMPTWPTFMPLFYLPIDHVFVSSNVQTLHQQTGSFNGSDHLPVLVELQIP
ncbi:endonuclease/exonuclease/phosphatase family protein [Vampirovibrio sp.]|uniref:endonuclease/exonuclease/phosphatase family protein n=1 Tax=Vampirovibrio sp. TaxID=2717857 RepID=UPI003593A4D6